MRGCKAGAWCVQCLRLRFEAEKFNHNQFERSSTSLEQFFRDALKGEAE